MIYWLDIETIVLIHEELILEHGGATGVRDMGLLESALARPQNLHAYTGESDICRLAASYGFGIAKNHPFVDGNKRTSLMAIYTFLHVNGLRLAATEEAAVAVITGLAAGNTDEEELAEWIRNSLG